MDCNPFKSSVGLHRTGALIGPVLLRGRACLSNHNTLLWDMISVKTPKKRGHKSLLFMLLLRFTLKSCPPSFCGS